MKAANRLIPDKGFAGYDHGLAGAFEQKPTVLTCQETYGWPLTVVFTCIKHSLLAPAFWLPILSVAY